MHVYVPLGAKYIHEQAKMFGEIVARLVHRQLPAVTSSIVALGLARSGLIDRRGQVEVRNQLRSDTRLQRAGLSEGLLR